MNKEKYYTCRYDRAFKEVFLNNDNNYELLKKLLESILDVSINDIIVENNELNEDNINVRRKIVDLLIRTDKEVMNVEVNSYIDDFVRVRNFSYICNAYSRYVLKGEEYDPTVQFIQINLNFSSEDNKLCRIYYLIDDYHNKYVDNLSIYEFNINKYLEFWYNGVEKEIDKYRYLIMLDLPKDDLVVLSKEDKVVSRYMKKLDEVNKDPRFQSYMSAEEDDRKLLNSFRRKGLNEGIKIGIEKGIEEGMKQGIKEGMKHRTEDIVLKMINKGLSEEEILEYLDISKEEFDNILSNK